MLNFEWDPKKAASNLKKHGISFEEACTVFGDTLSLTISDSLTSSNEERFVTTGETSHRKLVVVVHVDKGDNVRIISARRVTKHERKTYEKSTPG